jgi:hypothetical protein
VKSAVEVEVGREVGGEVSRGVFGGEVEEAVETAVGTGEDVVDVAVEKVDCSGCSVGDPGF